MRRTNRLAIKPLALLGTILFAAALLGGQPVQGQQPTAAELDRAALEALYDSTDGANWTNSTNWKIDDDLGTWYGVLVTSDGRVTSLNLANNNLVGTLPDELGNLTSLTALTLNKNQLTGEIPDLSASLVYVYLDENQLTGEIPDLSGLTGLTNLYLNQNQLTGEIPASLGGLTNLLQLALWGNQLTGEIPDLSGLTRLELLSLEQNQLTGEIPDLSATLAYVYLSDNLLTGEIPDLSSLTGLTYLYLNQNQLTGEIPASLGGLTRLQLLYLWGNQLTGEIPDLSGLTGLTNLYLNQNQLTGEIPASLGGLTNLLQLALWGNQLTGEIPDLSGLTRLQQLYLNGNQLTGEIPASLGGLTNLLQLALWGNQLTGEIPDLSGLTRLQLLYLNGNQLTGEIPDLSATLAYVYLSDNLLTGEIPDLSGLTRLQLLYLNGNQLTGEIPASLGGLTNLLQLALWGNQLTGEIPDLSGLTGLTNLYLNENQLTGEIPASLGGLTNLAVLYLWGNQLTGEIPDLSGLTRLQQLTLSHNQLTGEIPDSLDSLTALRFLYLNNNRLTGAVPDFSSLNQLGGTRFANNALTGCVPHVWRALVARGGSDFIAVDVNGDGDTDDEGDVPGLNLPFCMLSALTLSGLDLEPAFAFGTMTYTAESTATSTTVAATRYESSDRLSVRKGATSYSEGDTIPLDVGSTLLEIDVTPTDQRLLKQTHTVDVFRAGSAVSDREALIELYNSAGGSGWTASDGWNTTQTLDMWHGVTLDGDGRVMGLALAGNNLSGTVPASLSTLTKLTLLDLSGNQLSGAIPPRLRGLSELTTLDLSANGLSGAIPPGLGDLGELNELYLHDNALSGAIPPELGNLSSLDALYLHGNALSGAIPPELGNLSSLEELSLWDNGLSGPIPGSLGNLLALRFARFADNSLTGCVPHGLRRLVAAADFATGVPAHDFARDANGDGDTTDTGDIDGLALPFCGLSQLTLGGLTLDPAFDDGTVAYIASAGHSVTSTTVTATLNNSADGVSITKGTDTYMNGDAVPLAVGVNVITIAVTASDGTTAPHTYSVAVTRAPNTPPVFDEGGTATRSVDENTAANQPIGNPLTARDADGDTLTYSLDTASDAFFDIDSDGQLLTEAGLDHEARNSYSVNVSVSDGKASDGTASTSADSTITVTITVENVDEDEELKFSASRPLIGTDYTAAFKEGMGDAVTSPTWVWARSMSLSGPWADITVAATAATYVPVGDDLANYLRVTVSYHDGHSAKTLQATSELPTSPTSVNMPPVFPSPLFAGGATGLSVDENATAGTVVGLAPQATDSEPGTLDYSLAVTGFTTDPPFEINATSRQIRVAGGAALDHERQPTYSVTVTAADEFDATGTATFDITIEDVNERPVVRRSSGMGPFSIVENSGTDVGSFVATDPEGQGVTWSLETTGDHGRFEIDAANGALSLKEAADYERPDLGLGPDKAYTVTVQATEQDDGEPLTLELTGRLAVTVAITNVNEPPTVTGNATPSVDENTTAVATYSATDPEGVTVTWSLQGGGGVFMITSAGALAFTTAPNYEVKFSYTVTVRASDGTNDVDVDVTVTVTDVNEDEELKLSASRPFIGIGYTAAFEDGTGDAVQSPMWAWERSPNGTSSWDDITGATAATYRPVGADRERYLRVTVSYNDGHGQGRKTLQATSELPTLPDISTNMPPVFPSPLFAGGATGLSVPENATAGTVVGVAPQAIDPEDGTLDYSLAVTGFTTDPPFEINATSRQIRVASGAVLDHEDQDRYSVTVTVVDEFDATGTATFDITITNENERPVVRRSSGTGPFSIVENSGTDVGRFVATDPEGQGVTWSLETSGDHGRFEIDAANGALSFKEAPDYESSDLGLGPDKAYTVTVQATEQDDGEPLTLELTGRLAVTVAVTDENEPPTVTGNATPSVDENTTAVATYSATDPEEVPPSWSLQGGAGVFMITSAGALAFTTAPNYEVKFSYTVTVRASDGVNTTNHPVTVTVTDVDEDEELLLSARRPLIGADYTAAFEVGKGDAVQSPMWVWARSMSLSGPWADITVAATAATYVPVGADRDHYLRVTVSYHDGHAPRTLQATSEFPTLPDSGTNEPPVFPTPLFAGGATGLSVDENATAGTVVGLAPQATDPEFGTLSYSLAVTGFTTDPPFEINATSRQIRVVRAVLDHERQPTYSVTVTVVDEFDATGTATFDITIEDVNERPVVRRSSGIGPFSIVENSGTDVGSFEATDPEGGGVTWSLATSGDHGRFEIDEANGALSFKEAPDYESSDLGLDKAYTVTVQATEQDGGDPLTGRLAVTVAITNVNERPVVRRSSGMGAFSIEENSGRDVGSFDATDPEGRGVTWSLATSGDYVRFEIDAANGALSFKELPDFESDDLGIDEAYTVTVQATEVDGGNPLTGSLAVTVAVTDVNEPPTVAGNATPSVPENTTAVATYSATDPEEVPPSWSLQGGAGVFMITSAGALAFTTAPNYEVESSYTVTVLASDGTNDVDVDVTVTVTDVDEDEELLLSARRPFIGIGYTAAFEAGKGDAVQSPMWVWARSMSLSGPWADITVAATAATYVPVGADRDHYLRVTVSYHDGHAARTLQATSEFPTLPDSGTNEPPVFPTPLFAGGATGLSVDENATAGTVVGLAPQATDPEIGTLDYSLAVSGVVTPPFEINATSRQIQVAGGAVLDHEARDTYSVTVTAEDEYNATGTATFDITIEDVNERPVAVFDIPPATDEDTATTFAVLGNDIDQDDGDTLTVSITSQPSRGRVVANTTTQLVTYTPAENDHGTYTFMYTASDGTLSSRPALVTVTVNPVNDAPAFAAAPAARTVSESARPGDDVGAALTATDVDGDTLTYGLTGAAASDFEIDEQTGQITVATGAALNVALSPYTVTVTADDRQGETAMVEVTITVTAGPPIIITGGGGGGGGGGPTPSEVDFEWTVDRDIEQLDGGNDRTTGVWSDGTTLWVADNADGAGDAVYAYDLASGERVEEREFDLAEANRAPRGIWSNRSVVWVSDSGRERLFAYDLATGERLEEREFALAERNSDARGIWSDEETMWVLDSRANALFAYGFESGELLAEYALDAANDDPHGLWSDGVTIWVSDHGAKRLIAYRLPVLPDTETDPGEEDADDDARELERVRDEEFTELSKASNNSPRGIWSDGDVMYVADESDDRVYSYNMPDAIDARLASLSLSGVDIGAFSSSNTEYEGVVSEGVTETTVEAEAMQRRTAVAIDPPDADVEADGHQVALQDLGEIAVTVTSADDSRTRVYRVQFPDTGWDPARDPWPHCLRGAVSEGFSLVVYEGGSVAELISCAESRDIVAFYALHEGVYVSHILGAPDFVNREFREIFADGLPLMVPLVAGSNGPPSADPFGDLDDGGQQPWPECLRGDIAAGFSLVVYEGGNVDELEACARSVDITALYALSEGEFVSYILGAPAFVTQPFRELFADGLPLMTPLVARSEGPPTAGSDGDGLESN